MSVNIILHVGTEKTGSTSIQRTLYKNSAALSKLGYLIPQTLGHPCHIHLTACALANEPTHPIRNLLGLKDNSDFETFCKKTLSDLKEEISKGKYHTVLITDEHINMHLVKPGLMETYRNNLNDIGTVTKVILYMRRQDALRMSLYSEAVKAGNLTSFDPDNPLTPFNVIPNRFNYLRILNCLSDTFGKGLLKPRLFRRDELIGGDAVLDYLSLAGIPSNMMDRNDIQSNPSLDATAIWGMAKITQSLKDVGGVENEDIRRHMLERIQKVFQGKAPKMRAEFHEAFLSRFETMNNQIKDIYFPDRKTPLFKPIEQDKADAENTYYPQCSYSVQELTEELTRRESRNYELT